MLLVIGCGSGGGGSGGNVSGSCDTRATNSACSDYVGPASVVAQYKAACTTTWKDAVCDHGGSVGVMAACAAPSTYVAP